jgi:hypothetical protein
LKGLHLSFLLCLIEDSNNIWGGYLKTKGIEHLI